MINSVTLVGRIANDFEMREVGPNNRKVTEVLLAVLKPFKNENGTYDTDFIVVTFWQLNAQIISENCKKGDRIGITGRVCTKPYKISEEKTIQVNDIVADTITYLN